MSDISRIVGFGRNETFMLKDEKHSTTLITKKLPKQQAVTGKHIASPHTASSHPKQSDAKQPLVTAFWITPTIPTSLDEAKNNYQTLLSILSHNLSARKNPQCRKDFYNATQTYANMLKTSGNKSTAKSILKKAKKFEYATESDTCGSLHPCTIL